MSAISGTRRAIKELVDGTVRVQIDVDPQHRKRFFELFPDIDMPVAIAPLAPGFEQPSAETDAKIIEAAKGGELAKLAGRMCADPAFQEWLRQSNRGLWTAEARHLGGEASDENIAASIVRLGCGVESRAQLDHDAVFAHYFHEKFRKPWQEHCAK